MSIELNTPDGPYADTRNELGFYTGAWQRPKRILGIQAASRKKRGATEMIYANLIAGMERAGTEVDTVYLAEKDLKPCLGCFKCWTRDDGKCPVKDDITELVERIPEFNLMIFATPLYVDGMSGLLKNFIDRLMPLNHPSIFSKEGRCLHPSRHPIMPNLLLVSVCGFYEIENFESIVQHVSAISINMHMPLIATILRPETLSLMDRSAQTKMGQVKDALQEAGETVIYDGRIPDKTLQRISQPLLSRAEYLENAKTWWKK